MRKYAWIHHETFSCDTVDARVHLIWLLQSSQWQTRASVAFQERNDESIIYSTVLARPVVNIQETEQQKENSDKNRDVKAPLGSLTVLHKR